VPFGHSIRKTLDSQKFDDLQSNQDTKLSDDERIEQYLNNQHTVLWGRFFDIQSKEGRKQAKEFILDLLIDMEYTNEHYED